MTFTSSLESVPPSGGSFQSAAASAAIRKTAGNIALKSRCRMIFFMPPILMPDLMRGFPPQPQNQVTLANWRSTPFNRWAFHHVREIVPSADIPNAPGKVMALPAAAGDFSMLFADHFLEETNTDGAVILHRGKLVFEHYANGMTAETPHILMSVSKSMLGLLVGELGLGLERRVSEVLPEIAQTAYRGATIRQLLDMRAGIAFDEDYLATTGAIVEYRRATRSAPLGPGDTPSDLRSFYLNLKETDCAHCGRV